MSSGATKKQHGDLALYRRLLGESRPYWRHLSALFLLGLLGAPLALLIPLPIQVIVDSVLGGKPPAAFVAAVLPSAWQADPQSLLLFSCVTVVVLALLIQVHDLVVWIYKTWIGERLVLGFRAHLFDHMQRLSLGFHAKQSTADAIYRLQVDAASIGSASIYGVLPMATALLKVLVLVAATAYIDSTLALVALGFGPVVLGLTLLYRGVLRRRWSHARERESEAMGVVQESLSAVRVVKAFGRERHESARYRAHADRGVSANIAAVRTHGIFDLLVGVSVGLGASVILYLGARHVLDGQITLGQLLLVIAYLSQLFGPLRELGTRLANLQSALASAARVFDVLEEAPTVREKKKAKALLRAKGAFAFRGVTFGYDPERPIFRDVNLKIPAGTRVGIAGKTGTGKSTLLSLLPRFYDPQAGRIELDGEDIRDLKLTDLRRQFSIVLQDTLLFSTSIFENIAYGRPEATKEEIEAAAQSAAAHDFISALPKGYETEVGERGVRLSGGERQRIALARAFLRDAPVLFLDEPTSALDTGTEALVMDALDRLMKDRTTFMIAHRMSTLESSDLRLELVDGEVLVREADLDDVALS